MSNKTLGRYRREVLASVQGDVLEIGFGTGLNLSYYPDHLEKLVAIDANPGVSRLAQKRIDTASITVDHRVLNGEHLPMPDASFDTVVSTWTLCSIADVDQALQEIYRVLKPDGTFVFIEHGLSAEPHIQVWQNRLTPIQKVVGDGCHLNRQIRELVSRYFPQIAVEEFYGENLPKIAGYFYKGVAQKSTTATV